MIAKFAFLFGFSTEKGQILAVIMDKPESSLPNGLMFTYLWEIDVYKYVWGIWA